MLDSWLHHFLVEELEEMTNDVLSGDEEEHPLYESLLEMGKKKSGFYLYMGTEGDDLLFEHIATGTELRVTSRSAESPTGTEPGRAISFAIVVEGGSSGAGDAAPLGEHIIGLCIDAGYVGVSKKPQIVAGGHVRGN